MPNLATHEPVAVSLDLVWQGSSGKQDARMSEISMAGCFIDSSVQGRALGDMVEFKLHLPSGPWVALQLLSLSSTVINWALTMSRSSVASNDKLKEDLNKCR